MNPTTIEEGKQLLRDNWEQGLKCPCCKQNVKLYKLSMRANIAMVLIDIYKIMQTDNKTWVHVIDEAKPVNGDYAKLRFWGLLAPRGDTPDKDTKASGYWSVTPLGREFLQGRVSVSSKVFIFDNRKYGSSDETVTINQALGKKFSWSELMQGFINQDSQERLL